jgi:hypothetical protein
MAWVFSIYPIRHLVLVRAAERMAAQSIEDAPDVQCSAAYAVGAIDDNAREFAIAAANYAIEAMSFSKQSFEDALGACSADGEVLDQRFSPGNLAGSQLWPGQLPGWVPDTWLDLRRALLDDGKHWSVWIKWYDERLNGATANQNLELARALIPNDIWEQEPDLVNNQIQALPQNRDISLPEKSASDLAHELQILTPQELSVIGVRVAMRAIPLVEFHQTAFLLVMRAISSAWTAARYQLPADHRTRANSVYTDLLNSSVGLVPQISNALFVSARDSTLPGVLPLVVNGIQELSRAAFLKCGAAAQREFDLHLSLDLNDLRGAPAFAEHPIWKGPPEWAILQWDSLRQKLFDADAGWEVWADWYDDRIFGTARSEPYDLAYVQVPNELWPQGAVPVNTWIRNRLYEVQGFIPTSGDDEAPRLTDAPDLHPIEGVPNPLGIDVQLDGRIGADAGALAAPVLPPAITLQSHQQSLAACRSRAERLRAAAALPTFQHRRDYAELLASYLCWLPTEQGAGNILLADGDARILNKLFAAEEDILPLGFAAQLEVFLGDHIAVRGFYPELEQHFIAIKTGRLTRPLKRDAVEAIKQIIQEHTPNVFDSSVGAAMDEAGKPVPHVEAPRPEDVPPPDPNRPKPPKDPVTGIDPEKTWSFIFASGANRIWELLKNGKNAADGLGGWQKVYDQMSPHIGAIIDWLRAFLPHDGGGGPPMPPTINV